MSALRRRLRLDGARPEDGAVAVEFAAVMLLLVALLYALVTYGLLFAMKISMTSAAEQGARAALRATTVAEAVILAEDRVEAVLSWLPAGTLAHREIEIEVAPCDGDPVVNCIAVSVRYPYGQQPILPLLPGLGIAVPESVVSQASAQLGT